MIVTDLPDGPGAPVGPDGEVREGGVGQRAQAPRVSPLPSQANCNGDFQLFHITDDFSPNTQTSKI
jgi:hypothetical protein